MAAADQPPAHSAMSASLGKEIRDVEDIGDVSTDVRSAAGSMDWTDSCSGIMSQ
ncbi:MAG: hypothetical protein QOI30_829 [Mycobacterium sp.]|nr:hypothetical protein [Mycobacterium sp.]